MTWNSGPCIETPNDGNDPGDELLFMILDYGQACYEHGVAQARYEAARSRTASADPSPVAVAGRKAIAQYAALRSSLAPLVPLLTRATEPGA